MKKRITQDDYIKANRKANREAPYLSPTSAPVKESI